MVAIGLRSGEGGSACVVLDVEDGPRFVARRTVDLYGDRALAPFHAATADPERADEIIDEAVATATDRAIALVTDLLREVPGLAHIGVVLGNNPAPTRGFALRSHVASHAAEGALLRTALLEAATQSGLRVYALPERDVFPTLESSIAGDAETRLKELGAVAGRPWRKPEKLAAAIAWLASTTTDD